MKFRKSFRWLILLTFCASLLGPAPTARAQTQRQTRSVEAILESMTPEERVGQLFLTSFHGTDTNSESQIYDLIVNRHVGGVVLAVANDNFVDAPDTVTGTHQLIEALQNLEWDAVAQDLSGQTQRGTYLPLFVGISQDGGGSSQDQILSGLTPLPNAMAIGATWNTDLSKQAGTVLGSELSALGFNLYIGPSLDVVETPDPLASSDLGTTVFGGNPFWVGEMGRAYIAGLHQGSNNRMVVVAKHFPGRGSSDRLPEEEVATVRKSLEQLKQIELPPFVDVTNSKDPAGIADGLLVSHIRYQGFQGNIRATTRPISFDAAALPAILAMPEFASWRTNGGLVVSDPLGSNAVRDFYSQQGTGNFSPRLVARDAFNAGNDLLYLGDITSDPLKGDTYSATLAILDFFAQEYRNDPVFAQHVDAAVLRILTQKLRMYAAFNISNVRTPDINSANIGTSQQVMFDVARNAATLVSPDPQELSTLLPSPPTQGDRIVFLTDVSIYQQCAACPQHDALAVDALQKNVIRLYGQGSSGQILTNRLSSYPLAEVGSMLSGESKTDIEGSLAHATWVVISLADVNSGQIPLLRRLFTERPNLVSNKNVILFSFTTPYYLDATDISKLTAYYALYSKQPAFVDVAARLLFQQVSPQGASPVSIPAVGYDLITETAPDASQVISLALDQPQASATEVVTPTAESTQVPQYRIGDTITVRAGPILDHNHHIVPDGTAARFTMSTRAETSAILRVVDATTVDGVARATFVIDKPGSVEIRAVSGPAQVSTVLQFISNESGVAVTVVAPTVPTTPEPILPTPTIVVVENNLVSLEGYPRLGMWLLTLLALFGSAGLAFWAASKIISPRWGLRWALCIFFGGLLGYNYLALGFPGAANWIAVNAGAIGVLILTFGGEVLGGIAAWTWMRWFSEPASQAD
ncbi:MAG: glycoside hydrolase family 3 N-terminal domain-containing protein [Chloroflexota bacterium]